MLVAAPRYFSGAIQLGELMQISSAFGQVQESLSWFITNYSRLASWQATTLRLTGFQDQMLAVSQGVRDETAQEHTHEQVAAHDASALTHANTSVEHSVNSIETPPLTISLPNGTVLLHNTRLQVHAGDTVLVRGPSGCGKSTLFRTLAGIWPHVTKQDSAELHIALPDHTVFMPQRPYFPQGSLRQALAYPSAAELFDDAQLKQVLHDSLLPHLADQLDAQGQWTQQLSGGEQQRLAIARVLLKRPRWVFADEITSALDASAEQALYEKLLQLVREQQGALVSIAHRPGVAAFHQQQWVFTPNDGVESAQAAFTLSSAAIL
jgi:putative ATP-binding cassette transporter